MSNIYDALNKGKARKQVNRGAPEPPVAEPPVAEPGAEPRPAGESRSIPVADPAPIAPSSRRPLGKIGDIAADDDLDVLRQRIMLELGSAGPQVVVFIGAVPGEGTSTVALRFARGVALSEPRRVLLVDGDMGGSRAALSGVLEADDSRAGLSDLLAGNSELPGLVLGTEQQNLHFLPFGSNGAPNLELVRHDRVAAALREMTRHYSFIVIDAGASLAAPETALLASSAGGVVLVVRASRTRREVVLKGLAALNRAGCRLLGVVLNDRRYPIPGFLYRRL